MNEKYEVVKFEQDNLILDVNVSPSENTVWLTQDVMALLFGRNQGVISRHINSIFKDGKLDRNTSMQKMHKSRNSSNPNYRPPVYYYLDVVISVGYRVKVKRAIEFRWWVTCVLKQYLLVIHRWFCHHARIRMYPVLEKNKQDSNKLDHRR